jgi:precorrin-3B synthase
LTRAYARGACPGLTAPMETGDGLLARLIPAGPIPLDAFIGLCAAARAHGNGIMEITSRGSVQLRGLTPLSAHLFAAAVDGLDIDISEGVPVIADPLPDDPAALIDANSVAALLRRAIAAAGLSLAPKVSVVVDGGGRLSLDALFADIRLRALGTSEGPKLHLALAGDAGSATPLGTIAQDEVIDAVLTLLTLIAARGPEARAADVLPTLAGSRSANATAPLRPRSDAIGRHALKDATFALGLGLAFGHAQAETLAELGRMAKLRGADWVRPAPGRALLLGPLGEASATAATRGAEKLGFIVEAADPRRRIAACPGAPACAHGLIAARALAAEIVRRVPLAGDEIAIHVSGCAKGCAHQGPAPLTVVGTAQGCGIVRDGSAQSTPSAYTNPTDLVSELDRIMGRTREAAHA